MKFKKNLNKKLLIVTISLSVVLLVLLMIYSIKTPYMVGINFFNTSGVESGTMKGQTGLAIQNDNWFNLSCKDIQFNLKYKGEVICTGKQLEPVVLKKHASTTLPVSYNIFLEPLGADILDFVAMDSVEIEQELTGKFTWMNLNKHQNKKFFIKPKELVSSALDQAFSLLKDVVQDVKINNSTLLKTDVTMKLQIPNIFATTINLNDAQIGMFPDKEHTTDTIAGWKSEKSAELMPNSSTIYMVNFSIDNIKAGKAIFTGAIGGESKAFVKGTINLSMGGIKFPVNIEKDVDISMLLSLKKKFDENRIR